MRSESAALTALLACQSAKYSDRLDCCQREFGGDIFGDCRKPDHLNAQLAARGLHRLQIFATVLS